MSIQIGNVSKLYKQTNNNYGWININFKNIINNIKRILLCFFLYMIYVDVIWADTQAKCGLWIYTELIHLSDGLISSTWALEFTPFSWYYYY